MTVDELLARLAQRPGVRSWHDAYHKERKQLALAEFDRALLLDAVEACRDHRNEAEYLELGVVLNTIARTLRADP